jgi:Big-like domain-containing protein/subtilase family protein
VKSTFARLLVLIAPLVTGALPIAAQIPLEVVQPIQCSQPDPVPQSSFSCQDNWGLDHIDLSASDNAYRYRWTGQGVHVYVLDLGIHVAPSGTDDPGNGNEFENRIGNGYSEHTESGAPTTNDCSTNSHGTRVASIIGGKVYGVAKGVTLHPVKYANRCFDSSMLVEGFVKSLRFIRDHIQAARQQDPSYLAVVNVSTNIPKLWAEYSTRECLEDDGITSALCFDLIHELVDEIIDLEVPVVVSAGNYDNWDGVGNRVVTPSDFLPSDVPRAFVIGGVTRSRSRWFMDGTEPDYARLCNPGQTNVRPECGSNYGPEVDLWAPAEFIRSAYNAGRNSVGLLIDLTIAESFGVLSGTSFAAPHVTGAIAVYMEFFRAQNNRRPTVDEVWSFLEKNAEPDVLSDIGAGSPNLLLKIGPRAIGDSFTTPGGTLLPILYNSLLANDRGTGLKVILDGFSDPPHGTITVCCNPAGFKYTPDPGYIGPDSFTYTVEGDLNLRDSTFVQITVTNRPPVAVNDAATTDRDIPVTIAVLANDSDPDGHPLTITTPGGGGIVINPDGTITYTPPAGFVGLTSFPYTITDGHDGFASATVTVTVRQPNRPPVANANSFSTPQNTPLDFTCTQLLANDSDPDGDPLTVTSVGQPSSGSIGCTSCNCRYTPVSGFVGNATFSYTVSDGRGGTASVSCMVAVFNRLPVAVNDTASTPQNLSVTIYVLANDSDPDGNPLTVLSVTQPTNGSAVIQPGGGAVTYTPGSVGSASFSYTVSDSKGGIATANVSVTVLPPNTAPDARGNQFALPYGFASTIPHGTLLSNDFDPNGDALTISSFNTGGLNGTLSCPVGGTSCTYTPPYGFVGVTSYSYTVSDGRGSTDTATVKLKVGVSQNPPVAGDDLFTTPRNVAKGFTIFDVLANDSDPEGDVLNAVIGSGPRDYGSVSCTSPTYNCTYTPNAGYVGLDRFAYTADDQAGGTAMAYIKMAVMPPSSPGVLDSREDQFATSQNMQRFISFGALKANDYDPEGDPLTITGYDKTGLNGSLDCTSDPNGCIFKPSSYFLGTTRFKYTVSDGHGNTDTAIVRIKVGVANAAPVIAGDALTTRTNTPLRFSIFDLLKNDHDPENDPINVTVYPTTPTRGTLSCGTPQYWCTYTPFTNVTGSDSFIYVINDGIAYTATATVTVTVTP